MELVLYCIYNIYSKNTVVNISLLNHNIFGENLVRYTSGHNFIFQQREIILERILLFSHNVYKDHTQSLIFAQGFRAEIKLLDSFFSSLYLPAWKLYSFVKIETFISMYIL